MAEIIYTESYLKRAKKFFKKHPELITQYEKTIKLLELNPSHSSLRPHRFRGKLNDLYSVSVNISYRLTIYFLLDKDQIIPVDIGSHEELY